MNTMTITRTDVRRLAELAPAIGLSLVMPTHPAGSESRQDPVRYRNLLDHAEARLREQGVHDPAGCCAPLRPFQEDLSFWERNSAPGVALYADLGTNEPRPEWFALPEEPEALALTGRPYHLLPLLAPANRNARFYLLALGQNGNRLFRADRDSIEPVALPAAPEDFGEVMGLYVQDEHVQFHTKTPDRHGTADRRAMYHGQGVASDETDRKKKQMEYCRQIADAVRDRLAGENGPLVLAATEPLAGLYREAGRTGNLHPRTLRGSPEHRSAQELHREAVDLLEDTFSHDSRAAVDAFGNATGQDRTATALEDVLAGAPIDQIDTLFLRAGAHRWGTFDHERRVATLHDTPRADSIDLLNLAAVETLRHGGTVHVVTPEEMPAADPAAATLRFSLQPG